ncbi:MAG: type II toxin-antitoxin system RelE/ParE family toxin [Ignavibacteriaceae bacterium]|nr:type II toxin-antitoxin system RelE/ParE family toxin [Ignavibacteriaceae bacterium]
MKVIWTSNAINRFNSITKKMVLFSPDKSSKFVDEVFMRVEGLAIFPDKGRKIYSSENENIRELIYKSHRIVYLINRLENSITVLTILHTSQKFPEID